MARKPSSTLTEGELRLMDVLWRLSAATVGTVTEALGDPPLAYNTVLTTLRILEKKGYVKHKLVGRAFVYSATVEREFAQNSAVSQILSRFFNNSPRELMLNVLESEKIDGEELARLRELIARKNEPQS